MAGEQESGADRPARIGPYRILDELGEGGMAVVYLAEQEAPIRRRVALKILKPGMDSRQIVNRFESERQALAVLDHPNVAKIFDAGISDNGRPYFVMERVRGIPVTDYCDQHRLSTSERLELFMQICSAVQHAHHKGLIHRDLKPSNILVGVVDGKPEPKIIDFGIAKATSTPLTEETLYTRIGQIIGTPQYMSPEQASSSAVDIDTRSDIYSLGVILYELLVGAPPLDLLAVADHAVRFALQEKDPPRPSTRFTQLGGTRSEIARVRRTEPGELRRELRGDLDWIVMRAIEKDRTRRYETPNALMMECRRYLKHEPVLARPPSPAYLLRRFVRRNRLAVTAVSVAILAIVAGGASAFLGYIRATEAERVAQQEAETASQVSEFLVELFRVSDPSEARGNSITAREILDRGAERVSTELASEPRIQAALMKTMGDAYSSLGLYEAAQPLLDEALENRRRSADGNTREVAETLFSLAELARLRGDYARAEALHREALAMRETLKEPRPFAIAESLEGLGLALYFQGRYPEAEPPLLEAQRIYPEAGGGADVERARVASAIGSLYHSTGRFDEAETLFREALRTNRRLYGDVHATVASDTNDLGLVLARTGRLAEAEQVMRESLRLFRELHSDDHPFTAETQANLASILNARGDPEGAEALYRDSIAMLERTVGRDHMLTARINDSLGVLLLGNRRYAEAEAVIEEAIRLSRVLLGARHANTARALNNMAAALFLQGKYEAAEPYFRESLEIRLERLGEEHGDVANSRNNLADLLNRIGRYGEAESLAEQAASTYARIHSPGHWRAAVARSIHGASLAGQGHFAAAEPLLVDSVERIGEERGGSIYHRMALQRAIDLYAAWGREEQARAFGERLACAETGTACD